MKMKKFTALLLSSLLVLSSVQVSVYADPAEEEIEIAESLEEDMDQSTPTEIEEVAEELAAPAEDETLIEADQPTDAFEEEEETELEGEEASETLPVQAVNARTQAEAVSWMDTLCSTYKSQKLNNKGTQCVAVANSYFDWWGTSQISCYYAYEMFDSSKTAPAGFTKISMSTYSGMKTGDVVVWNKGYKKYDGTYNTTGHVAVVYSVSGNSITVVEQNASTYVQKYTYSSSGGMYSYIRGVYRPTFTEATYPLDVNLTVNGTAYNDGTDFVTFDVSVGGSLVSNDVKDYYNGSVKKGTAYTVNDIKVSGCYKNTGSASYSGTVNGTTAVTIPIVTAHKGYSGQITTQATCTSAGVKTYTCACGDSYTESIPAIGHNYQPNVILPTCTESGKILYTCSNCGNSYEETGTASSWTDTKPTGVSDDKIESSTFYRYQDTTTTWTQTGSGSIDYASAGDTGNLAWPSGFDTSSSLYSTYNRTPVAASETSTSKTTVSKTRIGWIYWHWCMNSYAYGPINRTIQSSKSSTHPGFHGFFSTSDVAVTTSANARKIENGSVCKDTYWWLSERVPVYRCTYTNYTANSAGQGWSDWSQTAPASADGRNIETKTMYRVAMTSSDFAALGHSWNNGVVTKAATTTAEGIKTYTCSRCNTTRTESIPKIAETTVKITAQPVNASGHEGETVKFTVTAQNAASYQWYYSTNNGTNWYKSSATGYNTKTLSIKVSETNAARLYRCKVTSSTGNSVTSKAVSLSIITGVTIITQPQNTSVHIEETAKFTVTAERASSYQWYYSKDGGSTWYKSGSTGNTTKTLSVKASTTNAARLYRCKVTDSTGYSRTTNSVKITIIPCINVTSQPVSVSAKYGDSISFSVTAKNVSSYQWFYSNDGGTTWYKSGLTGNTSKTLSLTVTETSATRLYKCKMTDTTGHSDLTNTVKINLLSNVKITTQPVSVVGSAGDTVTFKVTASNVASYQWYFSKDGGSSWYKSGITGNASNTLKIKLTDDNITRQYKCKLTDSDGKSIWTNVVMVK